MRFTSYLEEATIKKSYKGAGPEDRTYKEYGYKNPRSADSYLSEAIKLIGTHCRDILNFYRKSGRDQQYIFRGVPGTFAGFRVTDPSIGNRASAYATFNYYTLLMNNLPSWSTYPKREIICSTDIDKAEQYGDVYVVFPYDGAKIGICPDRDVFTSFPPDSMRGFNIALNTMVQHFTSKSQIKSWGTLSTLLKKINKENIKIYLNSEDYDDCNYQSLINFMIITWNRSPDKTLFDFLNNQYLNPEKNDFRLVTHIPGMSGLPEDREVWTDSKCVLVHETNIDEFMKEFDDEI
jgi:hypothetical protein